MFTKISKLFHYGRNITTFFRKRIFWTVVDDFIALNKISRYKYIWKSLDAVNFQKAENIIWVCWFQGLENAPFIVKQCIASIKRHAGGRKVVVITEQNLADYVTFPSFILRLREKGKISNAHYSDLLRLELLIKYGGIWIDATCYLTDSIISYNGIFMYQTGRVSSNTIICASSWFISVTETNNEILRKTKALLYEYWKNNENLIHYFLFHLALSFVIQSSNTCKKQWDDMVYEPNINPHLLQFELLKEYDENRFSRLKQLSSIHKLTYELPFDFSNGNSFYDIIFKQ